MKNKCTHEIGRIYEHDDSRDLKINDEVDESDFEDIIWHKFCLNCGIRITKKHKKKLRIYKPQKHLPSPLNDILSSIRDNLRNQMIEEWLSQVEKLPFVKGDK